MVFRRSTLLLALLGCHVACSTVRIVDDGDPGPVADGGGSPACIDEVDPSSIVSVGDVSSATLFGDILHVEATVDGQAAYALLDLSLSPAELIDVRPDLAGGAMWTHAAGAYYARVTGSVLQVLDAGAPAAPALASSTSLAAPLAPGEEAIASDGSALFMCVASADDPQPFLSRFDLLDPAHPGAPTHLEDYGCGLFGDQTIAQGGLWVEFAPSNLTMYDLTQQISIDGHGFATDGVHHYGEFTSVKTDGRVVATTLENEAYAFLYYAESVGASLGGHVVYSSFGSGEKRLLEVVDGLALFAVPEPEGGIAVVAFDLDPAPDMETPATKTPMNVVLKGTSDDLEPVVAVAHDATRVIVSDGNALYVVPIGGTASVEPLLVVHQGKSANNCP